MYTIKQLVDVYIQNTETAIAKVFKSGPGFPIATSLDSKAEQDAPDAPIDDQFPHVKWQGADVPLDVDLFGPGATVAQVDARIQQLQAGLPATQQEHDEHVALRDALQQLIAFSADLALFSTDYNNAAAVNYLSNPNDPNARARLDQAVERALYLFPEINGEATPVRWRFPERDGDFVVNAVERSKAGFSQIPTPLGQDFIRTDLSREAINGQVLCLARLYLAHPDPAVRDRLRKPILDVAENLRRHGLRQHIDQLGFVTDFSVVTAARRLLPRPLASLIPNSEQIDALKGGDKLMVYAMLRAAAVVEPQTWKPIADSYFSQFKSSFKLTTVGLFYKFHTLTDTKTKKYSTLVGIGGLAGGLVGGLLGGVLSLVGLPFLGIALLGVLAGVGGVVHVLMNRKVEIDRFSSVYESIQLEQRMDAFLVENEERGNREAIELFQDKLGQCFILQRRKLDALTTAYFVDSPLGKSVLAADLVQLDQQIAMVRRQLRKAKKRWCSLFTSKKRRKKYQRLVQLYDSLRVYRRLAWAAKIGAYKEAPKKIVFAHYAHAYSRDPADHNAGGSLGTVLSKLRELSAAFSAAGGLRLGARDIGFETITSVPAPGFLRTTKALTDSGLDEVQYRFPPESYLWNSRRSITKHPLFRFGKGSGKTFYQPGGALMAWALLERNGVAL